MKALLDALTTHAGQRGERVAFSAGHRRLDWATLARRVAGAANALGSTPETVALALPNGPDYVVADLAATVAGKRLVPIPHFFSPQQIAHVLADAGVEATIGAAGAGLPRLDGILSETAESVDYVPGHRRIIYTSGSSGRPKGVILGERQIMASLTALRAAVSPGPDDVYLSVLPAAQLLEQICGIFLPVLSGAHSVYSHKAGAALFGRVPGALAQAFAAHRPTMSLLAPKLLKSWLADLAGGGPPPPRTLRFVALGGAPAAATLIDRAIAAGIPVHEGYGLSEACSVVTMNRPGHNMPGTVGQVLDGLTVEIEDGEIVVSGASVMQGYLHGPTIAPCWRTGDLGRFEQGRLIVEGRKDNLIVTPAGRNISPEWVEALAEADPRVLCAALVPTGDGLTLVAAVASPVSPHDIARCLTSLPAYARPDNLVTVSSRDSGLLRAAGTPDRSIALSLAMAGPGESIEYTAEMAAMTGTAA